MPPRQFTDKDRIRLVRIPLLGCMSASSFLRRHWQKNPLLVRGAIPGFEGVVDWRGVIELAGRDDCETRLVLRAGRRWTVEHGPFARRYLSSLPQRNWTLLVQGVNLLLPAARKLLSRFDFIPHIRLDDLMLSYAPPGGGVGPHFDSYDVFLLQGSGQRLWKVGRQDDLTLVDGAPLKILRRFVPQGECVLGPGDMLYLPPGFAHEGVALDASFTYSIGFRAPSHQELVSQFLIFLEERLNPSGRYQDPDLETQTHPARIGPAMVAQVQRTLGSIRWDRGDVADFLGTYLTEPKPHVLFSAAAQPACREGVPAQRAQPRAGTGVACADALQRRPGCSSMESRSPSTPRRRGHCEHLQMHGCWRAATFRNRARPRKHFTAGIAAAIFCRRPARPQPEHAHGG